MSKSASADHLPSPKIVKFVLISSMVLMGACGLIYEYVLSVMGNYLLGTSYEELFIIIGIMMFAMGIGSLVQRLLTGNLFFAFITIEVCLGLLGGYSATIIYALFFITPEYQVALYAIAFLIGSMIGMEIPLLIRINKDYSDTLRVNLSEILCMDYIGSLLGALLFTYYLLTAFSLPQISFLLGITNTSVALVSLLLFRALMPQVQRLGLFTTLVLCVTIFGFFKSPDWTRWSEQKYYADPIIVSQTTPFQHLVLTKGKRELNFFINGNLQFSSSDEFIYHECLVIPAMLLNEKREKVLVIGGGDGLAVREINRFSEVRRIDLVDLDPAVIALASRQPEMVALNQAAFYDARVKVRPHEGLKVLDGKQTITIPNERPEFVLDKREYPVAQVNLYLIDADLFVRQFKQKYDRIYIDLPDPSRLELSKLYSLDFYRLVKRLLTADGFMVLQATSPYNATRAFVCIGKTLQAAGFKVLPMHSNVPSFGQWGWYLCWVGEHTPDEIRRRIESIQQIPVSTKYITPRTLRALFALPPFVFADSQQVKINTKMHPRLWTYYRQDWDRGPDWMWYEKRES